MKGMTVIVKQITRLMTPALFLLGVYVVVHGHLTPGGGFAGGVLLAGCFVLKVLAYGSDEAQSTAAKWRASLSESLGILVFLFVGVLGLLAGIHFFSNHPDKGIPFHLVSAGTIPISNIAIGLEVAAALFAIFITLAVLDTEKRS